MMRKYSGLLLCLVYSIIATGQELLSFSHVSGWYDEPISLEITSLLPNSTIYYTLDGSVPNLNSTIYNEAIVLDGKKEHEVKLAYINTTISNSFHGFPYKGPLGNIPTAQVIRAAIYRNNNWLGKPICATYFIGQESVIHQMPVFSIIVDSLDFFDYERGIYIPGKLFDDNPILWSGNYHQRGMEWERPVHFEYFDTLGQLRLAHYAGVRIHGNYSRLFPFKSLRLYARTQYGPDRFHFPFFENRGANTYSNLILRNSGQDIINTMFADGFGTVLSSEMNFETQAFLPAVLYINGEYWGIHNLREQLQEETLSLNSGQSEQEITFIDFLDHITGIEPNAEFQELYDFIRYNDIKQATNYTIVKNLIDIDNFIDYHILKMYLGVYDWPGNNVRMWKSTNHPKWRWISFDNDDAFLKYEFDSFWHLLDSTSNEWPNFYWSTMIFRKLIQNLDFRKAFLDKLVLHMESTFNPERIVPLLDAFESQYNQEIIRHINRHQYPYSYEHWKDQIESFRQFFYHRCTYIKQFAEYHLETTLQIECILGTSEPAPVLFSLNPNPAKDEISLTMPTLTFIQYLTVYSSSGQLIRSIPVQQYLTEYPLNITDFSQGVYFITARNQLGEVFSKSFLKLN